MERDVQTLRLNTRLIHLLIPLLFLIPFGTPVHAHELPIDPPPIATTTPDVFNVDSEVEKLAKENGLEYLVPTIKKIIWCESKGKQSARNHQSVVGYDVGVFQINTHFHLRSAQRMGIDIFTGEGNVAYGFHLLKTQGTKPWLWSKHCWSS